MGWDTDMGWAMDMGWIWDMDTGWIWDLDRDGFGIWIRDGFGVWVWDGYDGLDIGRVMDTGWDMGWDGAVVVIGPWGLWGWDAAVSPKHSPV